MIKTITLIAVLYFTVNMTLNAQTGKFLIGGNLGFSYTSDNPVSSPDMVSTFKAKTVAFSGAPVFGFFFTKNIMAGIDFEFSTEKTNSENGIFGIVKTKSFTLNPLVRVYFDSPFFTEIRFTWGTNSTVYEVNDPFLIENIELTSTTLGCGAGVGYDIRLAEKVFLEPLINYRWNTYKTDEVDTKSNQSHLFINLGLVFRI